MLEKPSGKSFAIVGIGTSNLVCLVIHIKGEGFVVKSTNNIPSSGIRAGLIINARLAINAIHHLIRGAEKKAEESIEQVYIVTAGVDVTSHHVQANYTNSNKREILSKDVDKLMEIAQRQYSGDDIIIHNIPLEYHVGQINGITDPVGMYGTPMTGDFCLAMLSKSVLMNLENCITKCNTEMRGCVLSSYGAGLACLTEDEMHLGSMIIDMGGGSTSFAIFDSGNPIYIDAVQIGGATITKDIAYCLSISISEAEELKKAHGSAISSIEDDNTTLKIEQNHKMIEIRKSILTQIIRSRLEEIVEMIVEKTNPSYITNNIVITGGASQLQGTCEFIQKTLNAQTRIGQYEDMNPYMSSSIGAAILISKRFFVHHNESFTKHKLFRKIFSFWQT